MPQPIDEDICRNVTLNLPIQDFKEVVKASRALQSIAQEEPFWKAQFKNHHFNGTIHSSLPKAIPQRPETWRGKFVDHWVTRRNWEKGSYRGWRVPTGGHVCLSLDGDNSRAISASFPCAAKEPIKMWDLVTGKDILRIPLSEGVTTATLTESTLIAGGRQGAVSIIDIREGNSNTKKSFHVSPSEVSSLSRRDTHLVVGTGDGCLYSGDLRQGTLEVIADLSSPITSTAISKNKSVAVGTLNKKLFIIDDAKTVKTENNLTAIPNCVLFQDDSWIAGLDNGQIVSAASAVATEDDHALMMSPVVCMHRKKDRLVTGHSDGSIQHHQLQQHRPTSSISIKQGRRSIVWQVAMDASRILSSSLDSRLDIHDFGPTKYYSL